MTPDKKVCFRCVANDAVFTCRMCTRKVCEHLCGNKVRKMCTCTRCLILKKEFGKSN